MKSIIRDSSVLTGKKNLEPLITLKNFPVFMGCTDKDPKEDLFADMKWAIDPETGVIQLTELIPLDVLYQEQHFDGFGARWEKHNEDFSSYIDIFDISNILEIGGGRGILAEKVMSKNPNLKWTIVEPNPAYNGNLKINFISSFFGNNFTTKELIDTIVFSHVLEHIYDPNTFLKKLSSLLPEGGKLIFAYPNLELFVRNKYSNALNFEHTMFLTDYHLDYLLAKNGFKIVDKTIYLDHSIFYSVVKTKEIMNVEIPQNRYIEYKELFMNFINSYHEDVEELNKKIKNTKKKYIYLFGAHIFSQYLLYFGLDKSKIMYVLDNSKLKQYKRLYGTEFHVLPPKILYNQINPIIILKTGIFNEEIKNDILENINPTTEFWE